jgi:hypothetical protein
VCAASSHPALRYCEELRHFLLHPGDLATCARWQELARRPAPRGARALLSGLPPAAGAAAAAPSAERGAKGVAGRPQVHVHAGAGINIGGGSGGREICGLSYVSMREKHAPSAPLPGCVRGPLGGEELQLRRAKEMLG